MVRNGLAKRSEARGWARVVDEPASFVGTKHMDWFDDFLASTCPILFRRCTYSRSVRHTARAQGEHTFDITPNACERHNKLQLVEITTVVCRLCTGVPWVRFFHLGI